MPDTPTLCVGTPRCHGSLAWVPPITSLQAQGPWGQTEPRTEGTRDPRLSTHGCPNLSRPSSLVLGATEPWPPHTTQPQGATATPWGDRVLRWGAPRGAHVAQHPEPNTLGAHPETRWVWGRRGGTRGTPERWLMALCAPSPMQSCTKCTAPRCSRVAPATSPSLGAEASGRRILGWQLGGLSKGDMMVTPTPP